MGVDVGGDFAQNLHVAKGIRSTPTSSARPHPSSTLPPPPAGKMSSGGGGGGVREAIWAPDGL